tara:strand:+ start:2246 stop:2824 length:579 start_codon:yes stop_codon:yes gene_type:complete
MRLFIAFLATVFFPLSSYSKIQSVYFAGGCFWCVEEVFEKLVGVKEVYSGYSGGDTENPTYMEVVRGDTGHIEATKIDYDSDIVDTETLLKTLFLNIDPFDGGGQFCDRGYSYRSAIFSNDKKLINKTKSLVSSIENNHKKKVEFLILPFKNFYIAEDYHQDYYKKNPLRYNYYKFSCGREQRIKQLKVNLG